MKTWKNKFVEAVQEVSIINLNSCLKSAIVQLFFVATFLLRREVATMSSSV